MRSKALQALLALTLMVALTAAGTTVDAQEPPSTGMTTQDIVPKPNSGRNPTEAGDRGGALQLLLPAVLAVAIGGAVVHLTRQSRRARSTVPSD